MMKTNRDSNDRVILILLGLALLLLHILTNGQYGFHRDELAVLDDARFLAWGYVAYPPLTAWICRLALEIFGPSLIGLRFFPALAQSIVMILAGLTARELGGRRWAQILAALAVAIAPMSLIMGALFQYVSFDYLWWVLAAFLMIRLLRTNNPRWWLAIGAVVGLGMMTKYTMAFFAAGLVVGVLATPVRRHLRSPWLWAGVLVSLLIFLPNLIWQVNHHFITLTFLQSIHARDVAIGRAEGFLTQQFYVCANLFTLPLWIAGLWFYFGSARGRPYRAVGWMYLVPLVLLFFASGRFYYLGPAYPMLIAAGAVLWEERLARSSKPQPARILTWCALAVGGVSAAILMLPVAPVNSSLWRITAEVHDNFREEIGWPELTEIVATVYRSLPEQERARTGILAGNYGEAGAINLYGPALGLPQAISGINSYWARGYPIPPPERLIVLGLSETEAEDLFTSCRPAARITNRFGVKNEETQFHRVVFICGGPKKPWPEFWESFRYFG